MATEDMGLEQRATHDTIPHQTLDVQQLVEDTKEAVSPAIAPTDPHERYRIEAATFQDMLNSDDPGVVEEGKLKLRNLRLLTDNLSFIGDGDNEIDISRTHLTYPLKGTPERERLDRVIAHGLALEGIIPNATSLINQARDPGTREKAIQEIEANYEAHKNH